MSEKGIWSEDIYNHKIFYRFVVWMELELKRQKTLLSFELCTNTQCLLHTHTHTIPVSVPLELQLYMALYKFDYYYYYYYYNGSACH